MVFLRLRFSTVPCENCRVQYSIDSEVNVFRVQSSYNLRHGSIVCPLISRLISMMGKSKSLEARSQASSSQHANSSLPSLDTRQTLSGRKHQLTEEIISTSPFHDIFLIFLGKERATACKKSFITHSACSIWIRCLVHGSNGPAGRV